MKRRSAYISTPALVALSALATIQLSPASAQSTTTATPTTSANATAEPCAEVHIVGVKDVNDSASGTTDGGFLATVMDPITDAANNGPASYSELEGGFNASSTTASSAASNDSWKPDVWNNSEPAAAPSAASNDSWKPDVWGSGTATTPSAPATTLSATPSATAAAPSTAAATTTAASEAAPVVGRTILTVESTDDTRAYLPGVNGEVPTYAESVQTTVGQVSDVLGKIDSTCPDTKVILLGSGEGAQAVSIVAKEIGAGKIFPGEKVIGVSLFADPSRGENQPVVANGAAAPAGASTDWNAPAAPGAGVAEVTGQSFAPSQDFGSVADRTASWCAEGDTTCAIPEGTPLRTLVANTSAGTQNQAPEKSLTYVADVLGPAVVLGSVETLAEDVEFGEDGFSFNRARSAEDTLIGRISADSDREVPQSEMQERLLASGMQIGGMALAAGVTIAKEVVEPQNIAQIAAASAVSPAAGAGVALLIAGGAAVDLVSTRTFTTGAARLADEAQAAGIEDEGLAEAAVQVAVSQSTDTSTSTYRTTSATAGGDSATDATTSWLMEAVSDEIGRELTTETSKKQPATYNTRGVETAVRSL